MTEVWKDIRGFEEFYQVSSNGMVKSKDRIIPNGKNKPGTKYLRSKLVCQYTDSFGYKCIALCKNGIKKRIRIHQIVWAEFNGKIPMKMVIDHIDGNPSNNILQNLQLLSHRDNIAKGIFKSFKKSSKYPYVTYRKSRNKWIGRITYKNKLVTTGHFNNELDAYNSVIEFISKNNMDVKYLQMQ